MWVVYDHPLDDPDHIVVRRWEIGPDVCYRTVDISVHGTVEEARDAIPDGCLCLGRFLEDDPVIVEVWI